MPGMYRVIINFAGREIPKSPYVVGVDAQSGDPLRVSASGPGLERTGVTVNHKTYFDVHTRSMWFLYVTYCMFKYLNIFVPLPA